MNRSVKSGSVLRLLAASMLAVAAAAPSNVSALETSARATCLMKDHLAAVARAYDADYPQIAKAAGVEGTTVVRVALAKTGSLKSSVVARSSGNAALDAAALESARATTYTPATVACQPVEGDYLVEVVFKQ